MLGTFAGVFTPSILTILGIILFLRTGFVVGNSGLIGALLIIAVSTAVSVLTSISLSAIATNIEVRGGGDYYLISRTLGLEFGGAIGIVLFLAQSISVAFYAVGFSEAVVAMAGLNEGIAVHLIAAGAVLVLFVFAWAGADVAAKLQFVIMALLALALISFYIGAVRSFDTSLLAHSWTPGPGAIGVLAAFAIFFPAVTGFTQGVSMSGDLRDPGRSLPRGTFAAVGLSTVVYVSVVVFIAGGTPIASLVGDTGGAMRRIALVGSLVGVGVVAATLSSAMASLLGAPRILQSMASDRVFPKMSWFGKGHGPSNNPRRATVLSLAIALATISLGSVNVIAPVVSMFFLISYGLINYATYYEARASSPSFRPRFRFFSRWASLSGAVLCGGAMLAINPLAGVVAMILLAGVYKYLERRDITARWADAAAAHHFNRAMESIRSLDNEVQHARNWRPQILLFSADQRRRSRLLRFAKWLEGHSGLTAAFHIIIGEGARKRVETDEQQVKLQDEIDRLGLAVHGRAVLAADGMDALPVIVQSFGIGRIRSNVVLFGWPESPNTEQLALYVGAVRSVARLGVSVMSLSTDAVRWKRFAETPKAQRKLNVFWHDSDSGRLALLAAYLCTRDPEWRKATIRLISLSSAETDSPEALRAMLEEARIDAEISHITDATRDDIVSACSDATLALLPMRLLTGQIVDPLGGNMISLAAQLPMTAAIHAGEPIHLDTDPESGRAVHIAEAEAAAEEARQRLRRLEGQLKDATAALDRATRAGNEERAHELEDRVAQIRRRVLSTQVRVERAETEVSHLLDGT
jgi:amino acid transporter